MSRGTFSRLSAFALATCLILTLNLHGCGQYYRDNTQHDWLVSFEATATAAPGRISNRTHSGRAFDGKISTRLSGRLQDPHLGELSGLVASARHDGTLWAINDSGNPSNLYAITPAGQVISRHKLPFANQDWEALDHFVFEQQNFLLVADTGDNLERRSQSTLYIFPEPSPGLDQKINAVRMVRFQYEGGPQNVEAVAVSTSDSAVYLIAKKAYTPILFRLSLDQVLNSKNLLTARRIGQIQPLEFTSDDRPIEKLLAGRFLLGPTGFDIDREEQFAVIGNYRHVYLYRKGRAVSWAQALMSTPEVIATHWLTQSESLAFVGNGAVLVGSEGMQSPLLLIDGQANTASSTDYTH